MSAVSSVNPSLYNLFFSSLSRHFSRFAAFRFLLRGNPLYLSSLISFSFFFPSSYLFLLLLSLHSSLDVAFFLLPSPSFLTLFFHLFHFMLFLPHFLLIFFMFLPFLFFSVSFIAFSAFLLLSLSYLSLFLRLLSLFLLLPPIFSVALLSFLSFSFFSLHTLCRSFSIFFSPFSFSPHNFCRSSFTSFFTLLLPYFGLHFCLLFPPSPSHLPFQLLSPSLPPISLLLSPISPSSFRPSLFLPSHFITPFSLFPPISFTPSHFPFSPSHLSFSPSHLPFSSSHHPFSLIPSLHSFPQETASLTRGRGMAKANETFELYSLKKT